ncbi:MAG: glycosyltransferase family 9 protein [Flavobacteriales bacterium]
MKILIIRFSSIGDIVLTFPVITAIKSANPQAEIHYATKATFEGLLQGSKEIDQVHLLGSSFNDFKQEIKAQSFDFIIDLHHNLRSRRLTFGLSGKLARFNKLNRKKWLLTRFKWNTLPNLHIVERYLDTLKVLGIPYDHSPSPAFFIPKNEEVQLDNKFPALQSNFVALVIGAQFNTKKLPKEKWLELIQQVNEPMIILGGKMDQEMADWLMQRASNKTLISACGELTILQSASVVSQAKTVITHDTGMMHIAACFEVQILSIWGSTTPDFGMSPYRLKSSNLDHVFQVNGLKCRPCSKIGFQTCPKGHFNCMQQQNTQAIAEAIKKN